MLAGLAGLAGLGWAGWLGWPALLLATLAQKLQPSSFSLVAVAVAEALKYARKGRALKYPSNSCTRTCTLHVFHLTTQLSDEECVLLAPRDQQAGRSALLL